MKRRDLVHKVYIHSGQTRNMGQSVRLNPADTVSSQSPWRIGGGGGGDAGGGIPPGGGGGGGEEEEEEKEGGAGCGILAFTPTSGKSDATSLREINPFRQHIVIVITL